MNINDVFLHGLNGKIKVFSEELSMAHKSVHTLAHREAFKDGG
jgi:hypothetical protein